MELKVINKNGEKILPICFVGKNRNQKVVDYQKKVLDFLGIPMNHLEMPFDKSGHGDFIQYVINGTINDPNVDYYWFLDMDAIPLRKDFVDIIYSKISDKNSIFGPALATNHRAFKNHIYAAAFCLAFSKKLYLELGSPTMTDTIERSDNSQELTWKCQENGKIVSLLYPSSFSELTEQEMASSGNPKFFNLGEYHKYGLGTQYGNILFHAFMQTLPRSAELFIEKCQTILGERPEQVRRPRDKKVEAVIVCKGYGDYLSLTLPQNIKYFDNIVVVTDTKDELTQYACATYGATCVFYDDFFKNGAKFNKGGALNFGLSRLKYYDWVVILDSDIVIREDFRDRLKDVNKLYGSYRRFVPTEKDYKDLICGDRKIDEFVSIEGSGCGFFQAFNHYNVFCQINNWRLYKDSYSAEQVDIDFLKLFCPLVENDPNLVKSNIEMWHLGPHGVNNDGRSERDSFFNTK